MNNMQANSAVRGLIFAVQKTRSTMTESMGDSDYAQALLADLHPYLFGSLNILSRLLDFQTRCRKTGSIAGGDLYNLVRFIEMKEPTILALLPLYGYPDIESDITWFTQQWPYLTDGYE